MSSKLLYSVTDKKQDLQRQLGCMNGIFQLFDRRHSFSGRRAGGRNYKTLPPGQKSNPGMDPNGATRKTPVKHMEELGKEKQRIPTESSRTSFSSSCSSTFSSVDCNKTAQPEPSSICQSIVPETNPSPIPPVKQLNSSFPLKRPSVDLRDIVKDSMYREARGLSVKTVAKEEGMGHAMKYIDSPRPLQQSQCVQPRVSGYDGSPRVLAKLREAPCNSKEEKDGSLSLAPKDRPRFSYDGRTSRDVLKSTVKLKELPRLSLDSREGSIRRSASESTANYLLRDMQRENGYSSQILNPNQEPGSNKRSSVVVARLMGLEAFPDSISTDEGQMKKINSYQDEDFDMISRSSRPGDESKQNQVSKSRRVTHKDPNSPQSRNANSVMKPASSSRFPLEPAPWRRAEGSRGCQKPAFKYREASTKTQHASPSVYGEIEKRLTKLEFKKSSKDLRALKQIVDAMQKKRERLENKKEDQPSNFESHTSEYSRNYSSCDQGSKLETQQSQQINHPVSPTTKGTISPKRCGSSIVIIKPAKQIDKPRISDSSVIQPDVISGLRKLQTGESADNKKNLADRLTAKDLTPRSNHILKDPSSQKTNARTLRSSLSSRAPQHKSGENSTSFGRSTGTVSPKLQQKKHEMYKLARLTTPSDLSRARRQSSKQPIESGFPTRKLKPKSTNSQQGSDQSSEFSCGTGNLSHQGDTVSMQSESNISLDSEIDIEVTSKPFAARLSEDRSMAALATATLEQPSPVSVLDATFYGEDSPSPVKKISIAFKDDETLNCDEAEWTAVDIHHLLNSKRPNFSSEFNHNQVENIHLVHNLRLINSSNDEATIDHIASHCDNTNPDHKYIHEILLASGFLQDRASCTRAIHLHQSCHLIHPNFFRVLEENYGHGDKIARSKSIEKIRRKLVFDTVNEILVRKKALASSSELLMIFPNKLGGRSPSGEKLLKEVWSEMDHLEAKPNCCLDDEDDGLIRILSADMMHQSEDWAYYRGEVPGLVLDIERLIFKDLIREVVTCEW